MGRRTNLRLAQSKPPPSQGFRGFDRQRQNLGLHRLRAAAHQEMSLPITLLIRLRFGHLGAAARRADTGSMASAARKSASPNVRFVPRACEGHLKQYQIRHSNVEPLFYS